MLKTIEYHTITVDPPTDHRPTWLAVCSHGDLSRSYNNRVQALEAAYGHILEGTLDAELKRGYKFDDSKDNMYDSFEKLIYQPLEVIDDKLW